MSKKKSVERAKKDEEKDLEEEAVDEGDEEEEEASPAKAAHGKRPRAKAHDDHGHDDGHGHDEEEEEETDEDDPYWWTPHAVLSVLVLIGVLGFFGVFNKALGGIAAKPAGGDSHAHAGSGDHGKEAPKAAASSPHSPHARTPTPGASAPTPKPAPPVPDDVKAAPANATKTASGLAYRVLKQGSGASPKATDSVTVNYSGWTTDGKMFDSSITRGQPATFRLNQVIKGWTEGVQLMKVGETTRFWIPAELAYGDKPMRPGAPSGMLVFDVELISIQ